MKFEFNDALYEVYHIDGNRFAVDDMHICRGDPFMFDIHRLQLYEHYLSRLLVLANDDKVPDHGAGICLNIRSMHIRDINAGLPTHQLALYSTDSYLEHTFSLLGYGDVDYPIPHPVGNKWIGEQKERRISLMEEMLSFYNHIIDEITAKDANE